MFSKLRLIIEAETNDLRELAKRAGGDPDTFYVGSDLSGVDVSGQDLRGFNFQGANFEGIIADQSTQVDPRYEKLLRREPKSASAQVEPASGRGLGSSSSRSEDSGGISGKTQEAIKRAYHIWDDSRGEDVRQFLDLMADDVKLTTLPDGTSPLEFSKPCHNKVEMAHYFHALLGDWDLLDSKVEELVVQRNTAVVLLTEIWRNRRTGKRFSSPAVHTWRFIDGSASDIRLFFDSARWSQAARRD